MRVAVLYLAVCLGACTQTALPARAKVIGASGPLTSLQWLAGSWSSSEGNSLVEEHWTSPSTNLMLGVNRTVSDGSTTHHEQLRIEARPDGVYYQAFPSGQEATAFKLVDAGPGHAVFANPAHDYPKKITYRRSGASLTVRIEGQAGDRVAEWTWRRTVLPYD